MALVCLVWGEEFADFFARYCVHSLLEPHNIPLVAREQDVTLLLYADRSTQDFLERCDSFTTLSGFVNVEWIPLEQLPATARTSHWLPWQHAVAGRNGDFDRFVVIIPDCVYAAGSLSTIIDALDEHDAVYGTLPQVCRETVTVDLEGLRRVEGHEHISFTALQAVELFIRHVNPKHAAGACASPFMVSHPELVLQLSAKSMVVSETGTHPFAVRSSTRSVSYTLDVLSPGARNCYLEILGVSAEPAIKFVEEYYRWPKLHRAYSRLVNLGTWAWNFRNASGSAYARSAIYIALDEGRALAQHRGQVKRPKTRLINATLDYLAVATRVYQRACQFSDATAAKHIALTIAAPGFHRHLRRLRSGFTVLLPIAGSRFRDVVEAIESRPAARDMLRRFLFLHVVTSRLPIMPGHAVFLAYSDAADQFPKAFVGDPRAVPPRAGLWGKTISPLQWVWESVFCIDADIDYSHLTWSMLDPVNGTSEYVLDNSKSPSLASTADKVPDGAAVKAGKPAPRRHLHKLALRRLVHWSAKARLWLGALYSRLTAPILRRAKRRAPQHYEIARTIYRRLRPHRPPELQITPSRRVRSSCDAISKLNIVDNAAKVTLAFYEHLGLKPQDSPVYRCLASLRSKLAEDIEAFGTISNVSSLERFELAWRAYATGKLREALHLFGEVIGDERLAEASAVDPRAREALIRAGEILGRHAELRGDASAADQHYRRVLKLDGNGIVARRLLLMLWREARIREAAELAPRVIQSDSSIVQHLRGSDEIGELMRWLKDEVRQESTTATGRNARDFQLQAG